MLVWITEKYSILKSSPLIVGCHAGISKAARRHVQWCDPGQHVLLQYESVRSNFEPILQGHGPD